MNYSWDFSWVWKNIDVLFKGLLVTLTLTIMTVLFGYVVGLLLFFIKRSSNKILYYFSQWMIEIFRGIPVLVTLVWLYYCLPIFLGESFQISAFWIAVLGLGLNFAALEAEILRAGYDAIPFGEREAAQIFGFSKYQTATHIVIPQAFWRSLAPTLGQIINTIKLTSLAAFISVNELFFTTSNLIQTTYRPLEFYTILAVLYLIIILPLSFWLQNLERKLSVRFSNE